MLMGRQKGPALDVWYGMSFKASTDYDLGQETGVEFEKALDRLLHRSTIINIRGDSYRLKEKRLAGITTTINNLTQSTVISLPEGGSILNRH